MYFSDVEIMYERYTQAICNAADTAIQASKDKPYLPKKIRNIRAAANAEHWKMRTINDPNSEAWKTTKIKRNRHRNEATRLKKKYAQLTRETRKVEAIMHSATSAMQKMGSLRKIANRRKAPAQFLNEHAVERFQRYWSKLYEGPPLARTQQLDLQFSSTEIRQLIKALPNKKAPGPDTITAEMLKYGGNAAVKMVKRLLNAVTNANEIPLNMNRASIVLIPKDKDKVHDPAYRRPISLMNTILKLLDKRLKANLNEHIDQNNLLAREQAGFRPGLSCMSHILTLEQICQLQAAEKKAVHAVFIDLQKAFDSVNRSQLIDLMYELEFPRNDIALVEMMYSTEQSSLILNEQLQTPWTVAKGVRQGACSSPTLFNLFPE
jgi:hypothetical protein